MADDIRIELTIKRNGVPLEGWAPLVKTVSVDESIGPDTFVRATGGGFVDAGSPELATIQVLAVRSDVAATLRLDAQSDAGIVLTAGGFVLIVGATIDSAAATNLTIENSSGGDAEIKRVLGGT